MKKKSLWTIIILAILAILFFSGVGLEIVSAIYDVNGDGDIDIFDAIDTYDQVLIGYDAHYDINEDGDVDIFDAILVYDNIGNTPGGDYTTILEWLTDLIWS